MQEADLRFLEESFKKYYFEHFDLIRVPERTSEREFGFQKFNSGMTRHISIKDDKELHLLFMQNVPSDASERRHMIKGSVTVFQREVLPIHTENPIP